MRFFNELFITKYLIVKGNRIYIPRSQRIKTLNATHEGHQGIVKTKQLLRSKIWFHQMGKEMELLIQKCLPCQAATLTNFQEPLKTTALHSGRWEYVAEDFKGP